MQADFTGALLTHLPDRHGCAHSYIALAGWGCFEEALGIIFQDNPLPAIYGRICPRPCESSCTRGVSVKPLAIRALKRLIAEHVMRNALPSPIKGEITCPERVAIVGDGPCGLTTGSADIYKNFQSEIKYNGLDVIIA